MFGVRHQYQEIHIGAGMQYAASIAAHGGQGADVRHGQRRPDLAQNRIHQNGAPGQEPGAILLPAPIGNQPLLGLGQALA